MPGMEAASAYTELRRQEAASPKRLYAVDGRCGPGSPLTDIGRLTETAMTAVAAGGGHVLDASHVVFPNGAITLVLILAESHLSIHTWPEEDLVAIDLFSCGSIDGQAVIGSLIGAIGLMDVSISQIERGAPSRHFG
jgi:S-adenosylmethionine decarboxylase